MTSLLLSGGLTLSTCLLANLKRSLLQILTTEQGKVAMVREAIHLDNALEWHVGLGKQVLDLNDALLLHPAIWRVVELLLEHVIEVLNAEATDVGKLLNGLYTWRIILHE